MDLKQNHLRPRNWKTENIIQLKIKEKEEAIRTHASETDKLTPANLTQLKN